MQSSRLNTAPFYDVIKYRKENYKMLIWIIAAIAAYFVKGLTGFANTLVLTSILSFGSDNINITPVDLLLGYPCNAIIAWKERKSIQWKTCLSLSALVLLGNIPGILFLKNADSKDIKVFLGFAILFIGIEMLYREAKTNLNKKQSKPFLAFIGIIAGLLCGIYGIGAFLSAYVSRVTKDTQSFKANICVIFFIENTYRLVLYSILGIMTLSSVKSALLLSPFALLGLGLGIWASHYLDEKLAKQIIIIVLMISGIALAVTNLTA